MALVLKPCLLNGHREIICWRAMALWHEHNFQTYNPCNLDLWGITLVHNSLSPTFSLMFIFWPYVVPNFYDFDLLPQIQQLEFNLNNKTGYYLKLCFCHFIFWYNYDSSLTQNKPQHLFLIYMKHEYTTTINS